MRIRITRAMPEGARLNGAPWPAEGEETDVPTAQGVHLVASGVADEVIEQRRPRGRRTRKAEGSE